MRVKIAKWGNSAAIRLPKAVMDAMRLSTGGEAEISVEGGEMRMKPVKAVSRLTREALIANMDEIGPSGQSDLMEWGPDRGSEVIDDAYVRVLPPLKNMGGKKRVS